MLYFSYMNNKLMKTCAVCNYSEVVEGLEEIHQSDKSQGSREDRPYFIENFHRASEIAKDSSLARTANYACPNKACETYKNPAKKCAVFMSYDDTMKNCYICCECNTFWK